MRDSVTLEMDWLNLYARQVRAAADACLDAQIEILRLIGSQVPWSSLPLKTREILNVKIQGSPDKIKEVTDAVNVLKATNVPASTPAVSRPAQNAYLTPLSAEPQTAPPRRLPSFLNVSNAPRQSPIVHRERGLRHSEYAMNSRISLMDVDDDDFEDDSRDAQVARRLQNQEFNQAPAGTLPVPARRSTRSTRAVNPVYFAPQDTPSKRKADLGLTFVKPGPSNAKKARPSAPESDQEYLDEIDIEEPTDLADGGDAIRVVFKEVFFDNGLIRIGTQPLRPQPDVRSAPSEHARRRYHNNLVRTHHICDSKFPGAESSRNERARVEILSNIELGLIESREGWVRALCDYTGLPILWSPGPRSSSLESIYPVTIFEGSPAYHAPPNVCIIMSVLNWAKRRHAIVTLPLVSVWLNASEEPFISRKSKWLWAYNAITNTALMNRAFDLEDTHNDQIQKWARMDASQRRDILEALRTGDKNRFLQVKLKDHDAKFLPRVVRTMPWCLREGKDLYAELQRIARSYGITGPEFDYYCTVASPNGDRVFYPFYILSMPQAQQINWDWNLMVEFASELLTNMRRYCNRHAQKAGYGEKNADKIKVLYWIGAFLCDKIKTLKANMPDATQEEIAFSILDRWGLPIVPWISHTFRLSLCKKDDHGIAMLFGFADMSDDDFDPVQHIDLSRATVTLDSGLTNQAMRDFNTSDWFGIRETLKCLPLNHPFWRVSQYMGNHIWFGRQYQLALPIPPIPEFETHLLSIDAWVDGQTREPLLCSYCLKQFDSPGQLVEHSRKCSLADESERSYRESTNPEQHAIDEAYFVFRCNFEGCRESFTKASDLTEHKRVHTFPFGCEYGGCPKRFQDESLRDQHMISHLPFKCDFMGCRRRFELESELAQHKGTHSTSTSKFPCTFEGCGKSYAQKKSLTRHMKTHSAERPFECDFGGCEKAYTLSQTLVQHKKEHQAKPYMCTIKGCGRLFRTKEELEVHRGKPHLECEYCGMTYGSATDLKVHKRDVCKAKKS
ncbi:hypothetical protein FACUT_13022 [Fusarium acutatum]|uniref:C2H2-type domain-containing protein n=1 Tax=Fusarium acutatum TaxID=78861 RepID=A0A8H4JCP8_9HYPO|nr:hypothetical protein FACUT_13022 [Fusarium acutatum]